MKTSLHLTPRRLLPLGLLFFLLSLNQAFAVVYLSSNEFTGIARPRIRTDDTSILSSPYRLRAKFIDGNAYGFQAANSYLNENSYLDSAPPPGTYTVALYYVIYTDYSYSTIASIGQEYTTSITVNYSFSGIGVSSGLATASGELVAARAMSGDNTITGFTMQVTLPFGRGTSFAVGAKDPATAGAWVINNAYPFVGAADHLVLGSTVTVTLTVQAACGTSTRTFTCVVGQPAKTMP